MKFKSGKAGARIPAGGFNPPLLSWLRLIGLGKWRPAECSGEDAVAVRTYAPRQPITSDLVPALLKKRRRWFWRRHAARYDGRRY